MGVPLSYPVAVAVLKEDGLAGIAAKDYMVDRAGIMDAGFACHGRNIS
jgi:hypothetical protein